MLSSEKGCWWEVLVSREIVFQVTHCNGFAEPPIRVAGRYELQGTKGLGAPTPLSSPRKKIPDPFIFPWPIGTKEIPVGSCKGSRKGANAEDVGPVRDVQWSSERDAHNTLGVVGRDDGLVGYEPLRAQLDANP